MELPCLLSLVNAVSVKVSLGIQAVVGSHLLMQAKVLHTHRLGGGMVKTLVRNIISIPTLNPA